MLRKLILALVMMPLLTVSWLAEIPNCFDANSSKTRRASAQTLRILGPACEMEDDALAPPCSPITSRQ